MSNTAVYAQQLISDSAPSQAVTETAAAAAAHAADSMSIITLISEASVTVQIVMLILLLASMFSWSVIFTKFMTLRKERALTRKFEKEFWSGGSMQSLYKQYAAERDVTSGMSEIFVSGYREYQRLTERGYANNADLLDGVQRAMRVELSREIEHLESQIPFLATVGSTSPYVGLFGTVWGIMNSFRALGLQTQQATVASVAPGIAEALIATAMGLFAAIPAVIAYNRFSTDVEKLIGQYEIFMQEFVSIVNRQLTVDKKDS
ncbi:MAG: protein TolQ [Arenicella sp.]|jgi:biopolymer transport protein TolQ|nr:protein TolQ [Arenicella sp.]